MYLRHYIGGDQQTAHAAKVRKRGFELWPRLNAVPVCDGQRR